MKNLRLYIVILLFLLYTVLDISLADALELYVGNDLVFIIHNFPDILNMKYDPEDKYRYLYAAFSGFICTLPLLISFVLKATFVFLLKRESSFFKLVAIFHIFIAVAATLGKLAVLATFDPGQVNPGKIQYNIPYIFRNHHYFYFIHAITEVSSHR